MDTKLSIGVVTLGQAGIRRFAATRPPQIEGVEYVVAWQKADDNIPSELCRSDIRVVRSEGIGVSPNRNVALDNCNASLIMITDDDIIYTREQIEMAITTMEKHPELDYAVFYHESPSHPLHPLQECDIKDGVRNLMPTCYDIILRSTVKDRNICFDTRFGFYSGIFHSSEDDVFFLTLKRKGLKGRFFPRPLCLHPDYSTGYKRVTDPRIAASQGAVIAWAMPFTMPLRIPLKAWRMWRAKMLSFPKAIVYLSVGALRALFMKRPWQS